jgi:hypothetical protein
MSGRLVVVYPDGAITVHSHRGTPDLDTLQGLVGGFIERVSIRWNGRVRDAYVDEDGLSKWLPYNHHATQLTKGTQFEGCRLHGNLVVWIPDPRRKRESTNAVGGVDL